MNRRDHLGLPVTGGSGRAVAGYEQALTLFHGFYGNPLAVIDAVLADDPEFLAGHALRAGLLVTSTEKRAVPELQGTVERAEALIARGAGNARERAHIAAARAWLDGEFGAAADRYNRLAIEQTLQAIGKSNRRGNDAAVEIDVGFGIDSDIGE